MTKPTTWALHSAKIGSALAPTKSNKSLLRTQKAAKIPSFFQADIYKTIQTFWGEQTLDCKVAGLILTWGPVLCH